MLLKDLQTLATKLATGTLFHVEKAGKAYSVDYSALAKAIIEEYADSTVGGSKQSVQAAIAALNSSAYLLDSAKPITNNSDLNTYITPGNYQVKFAADAASISNIPVKTAGVLRVERSGYASNNYKRQTFYEFNNSYRHIRYTNDNGNTWSTWAKVPTRADIDALTNRSALTVTIASNDIDPKKSSVSAFKCGNITIITGYFYVTTQFAANSNMFQISGNGYTSQYSAIFALAGSNDNSISRLKLESNIVKSDDAFSANKYYSFEIVFA